MTDLIKREDALAACDIAPPDEWNNYTRGGYDLAADDCKRNISALPAIDPAAIREAALQARIEELVKELNISRMASVVMDNTVEELEAKLTKAGTLALETILNERGPVFDAMVDAAEDAAGKDVSFNVVVGRAIRAALAELEKE